METEVQTEVAQEAGQWAVYLLVLSPEGVERRRLQTYRTQLKAEQAASLIRRAAARRRRPPEGFDDRA